MMLLVLLALTQTPTTTTVNAHGHGHFFQGFSAGNLIELEAHVQPTAFVWGTPRPTGTVTFTVFDSNNVPVFGPTAVNLKSWCWGKEAEIFWTATVAGTYTVEAQYSGDANYAASDNTAALFSITIGPAITHTHLTPHSTHVLQNGTVNFTANVASGFGCFWQGQSTPVVGGTVTFTFSDPNIASIITTTDASGNAFTGPVTFPDLGTWTVTATYAGDVDHNGSSATATVNVVTSLPPFGGFWGSSSWGSSSYFGNFGNFGYSWRHH